MSDKTGAETPTAGVDLTGLTPAQAFALGEFTAELLAAAEARGYRRAIATLRRLDEGMLADRLEGLTDTAEEPPNQLPPGTKTRTEYTTIPGNTTAAPTPWPTRGPHHTHQRHIHTTPWTPVTNPPSPPGPHHATLNP